MTCSASFDRACETLARSGVAAQVSEGAAAISPRERLAARIVARRLFPRKVEGLNMAYLSVSHRFPRGAAGRDLAISRPANPEVFGVLASRCGTLCAMRRLAGRALSQKRAQYGQA